ncbi:DUF952 domain-containing protein [Symbiobacterium terraclitae]|uniref:DUF952 domain-containing protein n=1 Tax=Symbiobacterium terraclitae TaxID=557451 RepID=UPI0035B53720
MPAALDASAAAARTMPGGEVFAVRITYHGTPRAWYERLDPAQPYVPADFEREGFIHCTDGREAVSIILTLLYRDDPGEWVVLYIDKEKVQAPIKYEDPAGIYPHIYGPLNRDAIAAVAPIGRSPDGVFLMPPELENLQAMG